MTVIPIPVSSPARYGASWWDRLKSRAFVALGSFLSKRGVPGMVGPIDMKDTSTGQTITVTIGPLFTRISVNGRDYYFDRFTGRFDGTGQGCS